MLIPNFTPCETSITRRHESPSIAGESEIEAKRRKIRKGTRSCWDCKRRKVRCVFASASDAVCIECQKRGANCVSQEYPEELINLSGDTGPQMIDRMVRIEGLIEQLLKTVNQTASAQLAASDKEPSLPTVLPPYPNEANPSRSLTLYQPSPVLHAALPPREDVEVLWKAGAHVSIYFHQVMTTPYAELEGNGLHSPSTLLDIPGPNTHPVLLAKHMFLIATVLQYLDPESHEQIKELSENPRVMMKRLADTAASLVTTNDELLGTVEGLECIMMEGIYQANCGNLRRAWISFRRALVIGQLMGIYRATRHPLKAIDPNTKFNPQFFWHRIVYTDRFHCLMLGLPQGSPDRSMASDAALANDTPMGRLERVHCAIASRILERNDSDPGSYDFATTQEIDKELQQAAKIMPSRWWLAPNLPATATLAGQDDKSVFWEMLRLVNQLYHYNLLNQLHLPFMLGFNSAESSRQGYSQMTCVNASREVLTRFITFRSFNRVAYCCRAVDFFALMAALTLLLAHLDSHGRRRHSGHDSHANSSGGGSSSNLNFLAHQHLGDRAILEQALENMQQVARVNKDALSAKSASLLRRLLAIEADAADGKAYSTQSIRISDAPPQQVRDETNVLRIGIPYFGTIRIAREGAISKETPPDLGAGGPVYASEFGAAGEGGAPTFASAQQYDAPVTMHNPPDSNLDGISVQQPQSEEPSSGSMVEQAGRQFPGVVNQVFQRQYLYPGLTASADDWAFQGVDTAFFDHLMRGAMGQGGDWTGWQGGS
ncbi:hypothetical protein F5B20DRAFT_568632 [Whalleya microplaca]|nr:hypothetical protein F5B20DRAFT_568632 [Whalleya microplaca]